MTSKNSSAMKINLVLALVLAVLATFALWYEYKYKPAAEKKEAEKGKLLPALQAKELASVRIVGDKNKSNALFSCKESCKVENLSSRWEIAEPIKFRADEGNINGVLSSLVTTPPGEPVEISGLEDPVLKGFSLELEKRAHNRVEIKTKADAEPYVFYFGEKTAVGDNVYTLVTGPGLKADKVYLLSARTVDFTGRSLSHWQYKKLFEFATSEVKQASLQGSSGSFRLNHEGSEWFTEPGHKLADAESVDTFLTGLAFINATDFVSNDKKADRSKFDLPAKPKYTATFNFEKRPAVTIEVFENSRKPPEQYLTTSEAHYIAKIDLDSLQKFQKTGDSFRVKQLLRAAEKTNIKSMKVVFPKGNSHEFTLGAKGWESSTLKTFDPTRVDEALQKLGAARITMFMGQKSIPAGVEKVVTYELRGADAKPLHMISLFSQKGGKGGPAKWYASIADGELVELDGSAAAQVFNGVDQFSRKETAPSPTPSAAAKSAGIHP